MCGPSQFGKTQWFFNVIGAQLDSNPRPILYIGPTRNNVVYVIEPKIDEMLRSTPSLWAKTLHGKRYSRLKKTIAGVSLRLAWGGSATEIAADSAAIVIVDELDRMMTDVRNEGNILMLADARHETYVDGKTLAASSPTEGNVTTYTDKRTGLEHWQVAHPDAVRSPIWHQWQDGSRHEWAWPCPHKGCRQYFVPRFKLLAWPEGSTPNQAERDARLACPHCGALASTEHREDMNALGVYVAPGQIPRLTKRKRNPIDLIDRTGPVEVVHQIEPGQYVMPQDAQTRDMSGWVSGLATQTGKSTFGALARAYVQAARSGDPAKLKGVINTKLGELWHFGGEAPKQADVERHALQYLMGSLPAGVVLLTCYVDVQGQALIYAVRGWGAAEPSRGYQGESWLIECGYLEGDTAQDAVWSDLEDLLDQQWGGMKITRMGVDSGYRASEVYAFARSNRARVWATKGHQTLSRPHSSSRIDVTINGKTIKRGLELWHIHTVHYKDWVHGRVFRDPGQVGDWHIPENVPADYSAQIIAEERQVAASGRVTYKRVSRQNHYFDCEVGNRMIAEVLKRKISRLVRAKAKATPENEVTEPQRTLETAPTSAESALIADNARRKPRRRGRRRAGGYVNGW